VDRGMFSQRSFLEGSWSLMEIAMNVHEFQRHRSLPRLVTDVVTQFTTLVSNEFRLARAEVSSNLSRAGTGLALIIGGAVLLIPALVILLNAAVQSIVVTGVAEHWAALIVGGIALLVGLIVVLIGVRLIKPRALLPSRTMEQIRRDAAVAAQQTRSSYDNAP
jgi:hypothetical protein